LKWITSSFVVLTISLLFTGCEDSSGGGPSGPVKPFAGQDIIEKYQTALNQQQPLTRNISMEVHMEGSIPRLKKEGKMNALRRISSLGKITYKLLGFDGDDTVKKEVMARYMTAEQQASSGEGQSLAINPENYNFKYKGVTLRNAREVHVFEVKPRQKRLGLFKGELWIDRESFLPVREAGQLVKSPSVFVKKMQFVREYEIRDGVAFLRRLESKTDTRIVGTAELNIDFTNVQKTAETAEPVAQALGR
jgi:hypothetical protein